MVDFSQLQKISSPADLKNYTEDQIVRDPNSNNIYIKGSTVPTKPNTPTADPNTSGSLKDTLSKPDELDTLKTAVRRASELAFSQGGGAQRGLDIAKQGGLDLFNPANLRSGIEMGSSLKADIKDIYSSTLDSITKMKEARKEGAKYIAQLATDLPEFFQTLTPEEIAYIQKTGFVHESTAAKMAQYRVEHPEADQQIVLNMAAKYSDAGILPTDSIEEATAKLQNSKIYNDQFYHPSSSGGDDTTPVDISNIDINSYIEQDENGEWIVRDGAINAFISAKQQAAVFQAANALADSKNGTSSGVNDLIPKVDSFDPNTGEKVTESDVVKAKEKATTQLSQLYKKKQDLEKQLGQTSPISLDYQKLQNQINDTQSEISSIEGELYTGQGISYENSMTTAYFNDLFTA